MARVTVEDCLEKVENRFALVHLASKRARDLRMQHDDPLLRSDNKECVNALREIAAGYLYFTQEVTDLLKEQSKRKRRR